MRSVTSAVISHVTSATGVTSVTATGVTAGVREFRIEIDAFCNIGCLAQFAQREFFGIDFDVLAVADVALDDIALPNEHSAKRVS
jgi:hypothetical protein